MSERDEERSERGFVVVDRRGVSEEEGAAPAPPPRPPSAPGTLPQVDFSTLVHSFALTALYHLGAAPDPETGRTAAVDLPLASQNIDILELIRAKTQGNLEPEEAQLLEGLLYEVHMRFVEATRSSRE
jgi:hypothetical protein